MSTWKTSGLFQGITQGSEVTGLLHTKRLKKTLALSLACSMTLFMAVPIGQPFPFTPWVSSAYGDTPATPAASESVVSRGKLLMDMLNVR